MSFRRQSLDIGMYVYVYVYMYMHVVPQTVVLDKGMYVCICICACTSFCREPCWIKIQIYEQVWCVCMYEYMHLRISKCFVCLKKGNICEHLLCALVTMYVCMHACMYLCVVLRMHCSCNYVCMYVRVYVFMCGFAYALKHARMRDQETCSLHIHMYAYMYMYACTLCVHMELVHTYVSIRIHVCKSHVYLLACMLHTDCIACRTTVLYAINEHSQETCCKQAH